jgi:predicted nucleic acid-binding Zn ribbon protein
MIASFFWYLTPVWVLLLLTVLLGVFAILSRIKGGRYARPVVAGLMKVPLLGRGLRRLSESALERSNPQLASAMKKLERAGAMRDPQRMQKSLSLLSSAERRAWMEAADQQQQSSGAGVSNRQIRRQLERQGLQQKSAGEKAKDKRKAKKKKKGEGEEERRNPHARKRGKKGRRRGR